MSDNEAELDLLRRQLSAMKDAEMDRATWAGARAKELAGVLRPLINPAYTLRDFKWAFMDGMSLRTKATAALARYDAGPDGVEEE